MPPERRKRRPANEAARVRAQGGGAAAEAVAAGARAGSARKGKLARLAVRQGAARGAAGCIGRDQDGIRFRDLIRVRFMIGFDIVLVEIMVLK